MPRPTWDGVVQQLTVPDVTAQVAPPMALPRRALTPVEEARVESVRRVCNLRVGQAADDRLAGMPQMPAIPGPPSLQWEEDLGVGLVPHRGLVGSELGCNLEGMQFPDLCGRPRHDRQRRLSCGQQ